VCFYYHIVTCINHSLHPQYSSEFPSQMSCLCIAEHHTTYHHFSWQAGELKNAAASKAGEYKDWAADKAGDALGAAKQRALPPATYWQSIKSWTTGKPLEQVQVRRCCSVDHCLGTS
jgi:hypothetical protein